MDRWLNKAGEGLSAVWTGAEATLEKGQAKAGQGLSAVRTAAGATLEKGQAYRGAAPGGGYQCGDFTMGLISQATQQELPPAQYGIWGEDSEAEGEFGPPLRHADFASPLSTPADGSRTVYDVFRNSVHRSPDNQAVGSRKLIKAHKVQQGSKTFEKLELANSFDFLTYRQYMDRVTRFASGLVGLTGIPAKGRMVIYAETQQDWMVAALAAFSFSIEVVTIYATLGKEGALFGLNQTAASVCVVDSKLLKVLAEIVPDCHSLKHVITMSGCDDESMASLRDVGLTSVNTFQEVIDQGSLIEPRPPEPSDTAVIMYTSGTTGAPKGVVLSHANLTAACAGFYHAASSAGVTSQDCFLAYLPLAHIMEMIAEMSILMLGASMGYGSPHTLIASSVKLKRPESEGDASILKPTFMVFAPAVFDKVYKGVLSKVEAKGGVAKWVFEKALDKGMRDYENGCIGLNPVLNLVFQDVQAALGGRVAYAVTGSAPLSPEIQRFMQTVLKAPVRQGYGLTENCACGTLGMKMDNAVKSVGGPLPCTTIRLADWPEGSDPCRNRKRWKLRRARGSPGFRRSTKHHRPKHLVHMADPSDPSGDKLLLDNIDVIATTPWQFAEHGDQASSTHATYVDSQCEGTRKVRTCSGSCHEAPMSAEAIEIEGGPAAGRQRVDASAQCNLDDLAPPQSRPLLLRQHRMLIDVIARQCLHCCALPGRDKHFCQSCAVLPGRDATTPAMDEFIRAKSVPAPHVEYFMAGDVLRRTASEQAERPAWVSNGSLRLVRQTCRPMRSTGTSLRPQEAKQSGDAVLISRRVSFAGMDGRKLGENGRLCPAEPVMCNKGSMQEVIPPEVTSADLEEYWRAPLALPCAGNSQCPSASRARMAIPKRARVSVLLRMLFNC